MVYRNEERSTWPFLNPISEQRAHKERVRMSLRATCVTLTEIERLPFHPDAESDIAHASASSVIEPSDEEWFLSTRVARRNRNFTRLAHSVHRFFGD